GAVHRTKSTPSAAHQHTHGEDHSMETPQPAVNGETLYARDVADLRVNDAYTDEGRQRPDPQPRLEACYRAVAEAVAAEFPQPFLGGKSMGGRIASHIVADGFPAAGLAFLGYLRIPPGPPERIRDPH